MSISLSIKRYIPWYGEFHSGIYSSREGDERYWQWCSQNRESSDLTIYNKYNKQRGTPSYLFEFAIDGIGWDLWRLDGYDPETELADVTLSATIRVDGDRITGMVNNVVQSLNVPPGYIKDGVDMMMNWVKARIQENAKP